MSFIFDPVSILMQLYYKMYARHYNIFMAVRDNKVHKWPGDVWREYCGVHRVTEIVKGVEALNVRCLP